MSAQIAPTLFFKMTFNRGQFQSIYTLRLAFEPVFLLHILTKHELTTEYQGMHKFQTIHNLNL